jgi:hypothetical protein
MSWLTVGINSPCYLFALKKHLLEAINPLSIFKITKTTVFMPNRQVCQDLFGKEGIKISL